MPTLTEKQRKQRQEWITGKVDLTFKQEERITEFERMLKRLGLTEEQCHENEECAAWCRLNRNGKYVPEKVLANLRVHTIYDDSLAPFSFIKGTVIPEPQPLQVQDDLAEAA